MSQSQTNGVSSGGDDNLFRCHVCGGRSAHAGAIDQVFSVGGRPVLVERIPATVCDRCGEALFSRETTEAIRELIHGSGKPVKTVP